MHGTPGRLHAWHAREAACMAGHAWRGCPGSRRGGAVSASPPHRGPCMQQAARRLWVERARTDGDARGAGVEGGVGESQSPGAVVAMLAVTVGRMQVWPGGAERGVV